MRELTLAERVRTFILDDGTEYTEYLCRSCSYKLKTPDLDDPLRPISIDECYWPLFDVDGDGEILCIFEIETIDDTDKPLLDGGITKQPGQDCLDCRRSKNSQEYQNTLSRKTGQERVREMQLAVFSVAASDAVDCAL